MKGIRISAAVMVVGLAAFALIHAVPAHSYLPMGSVAGGTFSPVQWATTPVPIEISTVLAAGAKVSGNTHFETVIQASLATWAQAPNFADPIGTATLTTNDTQESGINKICFCTGQTFNNFNNNDGTLALTVTTTSGNQIVGANIFFNPQPSGICWATDSGVTSCPNASDAVQDLQTVATHELGHFIGLDHSAVVRATMYPFAPANETTLSWDDVAGASVLYPKSAADVAIGAISGTITLDSGAVFGAHVFADSASGTNPFGAFPNLRKSPIGTLTDVSGAYTIQGLPPDTYNVLAEPLDGPVDTTNVDWAAAWGQSGLQTNFTTRFH